MSIISLALIKHNMNIENSDSDTLLENIIAMVHEKIDGYLNQNIQAGNNTHYFNGNGTVNYIIPYFPVNSITSLHYRILPSDSWTELVYQTDFYLRYKHRLTMLYDAAGFYPNYEYKLIFNSGFSTIPADVQMVAMQMVKVAYDESTKGQNRLGVASITENKGNVSVATVFVDLTARQQRDLSRYRILAR